MSKPRSSSVSVTMLSLTVGAMLLTGCKEQGAATQPPPSAAAPAAGATAPQAGEAQAPKALSMKLGDQQAALDFLKQSDLKLEGAPGECALLAEEGTLGALATKARADATEWSVSCEPDVSAKVWACKARFARSGGSEEEATGFMIDLQYKVDDATRTLQKDSLVCLMAG